MKAFEGALERCPPLRARQPQGALGGSVVVDRERAYRTITLGGGAEELLHSRVLRKATVPIG